MADQTFVIVGAALAGAKAAETLRSEGFEGRIVLIGAEDERPYERPPLSKDYLRRETERDQAYVHGEGFYAAGEIELRTGTVVDAIDVSGRTVTLAGGEQVGYDALLLATGAAPRRLPVPGDDLEGVHYLRDMRDCDALAARLERGGRAVVVGSGWIGAEVAASARQKGLDVVLVEEHDVPLQEILGREMGEIYAAIHREQGVELVAGVAVEAFEGSGAVEAVRLAGGQRLECDFAVVGVGVEPRVELASAAGIAVDNGVLADARLATSAPRVFAAGDVANAEHPFYGSRLRVEHWHNALEQGPAAARSMLGKGSAYDRIPYFFSDQYEVGMEYAGLGGEDDEVVFRGDVDGREFIAFWLSADGRVTAGMNVNVWDVTDQIQALIRSRAAVDRARLLDVDVPLEELVPSG